MLDFFMLMVFLFLFSSCTASNGRNYFFATNKTCGQINSIIDDYRSFLRSFLFFGVVSIIYLFFCIDYELRITRKCAKKNRAGLTVLGFLCLQAFFSDRVR